jgi:thermitase
VYPGNDPNVICAAACDIEDNELDFGFYGEEVDITAPGVNLWVAETSPSPVVGRSHGSSYATAIIAGACALWQAHHGRDRLVADYTKRLLFPLFKHCLQESAFVPATGWDKKRRGAGILDVEHLLNFKLPKKADVQALPYANFG